MTTGNETRCVHFAAFDLPVPMGFFQDGHEYTIHRISPWVARDGRRTAVAHIISACEKCSGEFDLDVGAMGQRRLTRRCPTCRRGHTDRLAIALSALEDEQAVAGRSRVRLQAWRKRFITCLSQSNALGPDAARQAFARAKSTLIERGEIETDGMFVWPRDRVQR